MILSKFRNCNRLLSTNTSPVDISTLNNGLRIVTDSTPGHFSALGAYVNAGSRFETNTTSGISHLLDIMAWKSTTRKSGVQMMEDLAKLGGNYMCGAQRESILYQASVFNKDVGKMLECIAETIKEPQLSITEFEEAKLTAAYELEELSFKHDALLPEVLHEVAYSKQTLGMPLYGDLNSLSSLSLKDVKKFHEAHYAPNNIVLAMVGVEHERAVRMADSLLGDWQGHSIQTVSRIPPALYQGGEICLPYQEPRFANLPRLVHMQIAFETQGLLSSDLYSLAILQKLLGGGSSFSAGGPGKGMFSRLFRVLNQYSFVENCMAFNHAHIDTGLFGITISCYSEYAEHMAQVVCHELAKIMEFDPKLGGITTQEFTRARNQLVSSLLMNVESKLAALEDIGRQVQCQNKVIGVDEMVRQIKELGIANIREVARKVFQGNGGRGESRKPSVVLQGERISIGNVEQMLYAHGLGKRTNI